MSATILQGDVLEVLAVGIELYDAYVKIANRRLRKEVGLFA